MLQLNLRGLVVASAFMALAGCDGAVQSEPGTAGAGADGGGAPGTATTLPENGGGPATGGNSSNGGGDNAAGGAVNQGGSSTTSIRSDCSAPSDCVLTSVSCCGTCGAPTRSDVVALRTDALAEHQASACGTGPTMCPACATMINPDLFATCDNSACSVVDLATSELSVCSVDADCVLRVADCCECGASMERFNLIALSKTGRSAYPALVCDPNTACAECLPTYPTSPTPTCVEGHCRVERQM